MELAPWLLGAKAPGAGGTAAGTVPGAVAGAEDGEGESPSGARPNVLRRMLEGSFTTLTLTPGAGCTATPAAMGLAPVVVAGTGAGAAEVLIAPPGEDTPVVE